jgi:serine/threonine-protein kinase
MAVELSKGAQLLHYRIVSKIGAGGMGDVYLAEDTKLDRKVAIKFLREEYSKDSDKLGRFVREAKAASALNHPHILTVYEIGDVGDTNYIATEYIEGSTLRDVLNKKEPSQLNHVLKIGVQVSEALAAAHAAGIVHRDVKPENIMIRKDGYAKVLDFGLAKLAEQKTPENVSAEGETKALVHTNPGAVMGTVWYMSPEQARGKETDLRTDIWSLGVVLYEMLAGRVPFTGETSNHTIVAILEKEPLLLENVPDELQRIVRKSLTKDADMRYQSARDMLIDLKNLRRDLDIQGELERSVVPNRETRSGISGDGATQSVLSRSGSTQSGQIPPTQSVTTSSSSLEYAVNQAKSHKLGSAVIGLILIGLIGGGVYFGFLRTGGARQISSIAVMPFVNDSGSPDGEYLSDGMTETLINSLSQVPNLSVKARSSVFRYKGKDIDPKKVAAELNVDAVLIGHLLQRGDQLTLNVELINAQTENEIWGNKYERKASDLVALQSEIARDVSSELKAKLSGAETAKIEKTYTANPEAYQLYLKGRYQWNRRTADSLRQAIEFYKQAVEKDPNYGLGYAGLAETYILLPQYSVASPNDTMPQAKAMANKALAIDDSLVEAHTVLADYLALYEFDRVAAEKEFRRATDLNPNYATAHQWMSTDLYIPVKRFDEATAQIQLAQNLDPLSPIIGCNAGDMMLYARRYDDAFAQYKRVLATEPNFQFAHFELGLVLQVKGMYQEAIAEFRKGLELGYDSQNTGFLAFSLARSGQKDEAMKLLESLKKESAEHYVQSYSVAVAYLGLGNKDEALTWLEKDAAEHSTQITVYAVDPTLDDLRAEPRFKDILKRLNLPE